MKVKIGDRYYDSKSEPIMIILEDDEQDLISSMSTTDTKFCVFPDHVDVATITEFMEIKS